MPTRVSLVDSSSDSCGILGYEPGVTRGPDTIAFMNEFYRSQASQMKLETAVSSGCYQSGRADPRIHHGILERLIRSCDVDPDPRMLD